MQKIRLIKSHLQYLLRYILTFQIHFRGPHQLNHYSYCLFHHIFHLGLISPTHAFPLSLSHSQLEVHCTTISPDLHSPTSVPHSIASSSPSSHSAPHMFALHVCVNS